MIISGSYVRVYNSISGLLPPESAHRKCTDSQSSTFTQMERSMKSIGSRLRTGFYIGGLLLGCLAQLPLAQAQSSTGTVTGKWAASDQKLDNGEDRKILLDLEQNGS